MLALRISRLSHSPVLSRLRVVGIVALLLSHALYAQGTRLAVLPVEGGSNELGSDVLKAVQEINRYTVVDKALTGETSETGLVQSGLLQDHKRILSLGELFDVSKLLISKLEKLDAEKVRLTLQIVDVQSGKVEHEATADANDSVELQSMMPQTIERLMISSLPKPVTPPPVAKQSGWQPVWRSALVPGWGQFYSGRPGRGGAFLGANVVLGWFLISSVRSYHDAVKDHDRAIQLGVLSLGASDSTSAIAGNGLAFLRMKQIDQRINQTRRYALFSSLGLLTAYGWNVYDAFRIGQAGVAVQAQRDGFGLSYMVRY